MNNNPQGCLDYIMTRRAGEQSKVKTTKSRINDVERQRDLREIERLENGECVEIPTCNFSEPPKINYNSASVEGSIKGKNNSPWEKFYIGDE